MRGEAPDILRIQGRDDGLARVALVQPCFRAAPVAGGMDDVFQLAGVALQAEDQGVAPAASSSCAVSNSGRPMMPL